MLSGLAPETWERYLGRILVLILAWLVWSSGSWTRRYFIGKHPAERLRRRRLALYYGFPYRVMGMRLYHLVEVIEASEEIIETPAEEIALWQRINIYDARAMLGLYCYRAGYYPAALAQWTRIPESNRALRPEIARLLTEVDSRIALEKQETQPLKRDQILSQMPIIAGNLPPADLPNPHEPIRSEETEEARIGSWAKPADPAYELDDDDREKPQLSAPLRIKAESLPPTNGHHGNRSGSGVLPASHASSPTRQNWLVRLLHLSPPKGT